MSSDLRLLPVALLLLVGLVPATPLGAQDPHRAPRGYDPIQAGQDAYVYHEQLRLRDVNRQLMLQDELRWWAGWPGGASFGPGVSVASGPACLRLGPAGLDGVAGRIVGPLPAVPRNVWRYRLFDGVPQSIGQAHIQTGPNRWESHPVYPGSTFPGVVPATRPAGIEPRTEGRAAEPGPTSPPAGGEVRRPVEF